MPAYNLTGGAAYLIIVSTTGIIWSHLVLYIRVFLRRNINGPFGWDDAACAAATVTGTAESIVTLVAVHHGLGSHVSDIAPDELASVVILLWLIQMIYVLTVGMSMLSMAFLITKLTAFPTHLFIARIVSVLIGVWTLVSTLILTFQCDMPSPWKFDPPSRCVNRWNLWLCITILQAVLELCNFKTAFILVLRVRMPWKAKAKVLVAFALRLLVLPPTFARLMHLQNALYSHDPTHARIAVNLMDQVVMHIGILLATIPCAKPFFVVLERGVFKSPFDPETPDVRFRHASAEDPSLANLSSIPQSVPSSWNYRNTFAKRSITQLPQITRKRKVMFAPWTWNRRATSAYDASLSLPLQTNKSKSSNSSSHSNRPRSRQGYSSNHGSHQSSSNSSRPGRYGHQISILQSPQESMVTGDAELNCEEDNNAPHRSPSHSGPRSQSGVEPSFTFRPDDGKTVSRVHHDPVRAAGWREVRLDETASQRDLRTAGIETTQTVEITYESRNGRLSPKG